MYTTWQKDCTRAKTQALTPYSENKNKRKHLCSKGVTPLKSSKKARPIGRTAE